MKACRQPREHREGTEGPDPGMFRTWGGRRIQNSDVECTVQVQVDKPTLFPVLNIRNENTAIVVNEIL